MAPDDAATGHFEQQLAHWLAAPSPVEADPVVAIVLRLDPVAFTALRHFVRGSRLRARTAAREVMRVLADAIPLEQQIPVGNTPEPAAPTESSVPERQPDPAIVTDAVRHAEIRVLAVDELEEALERLSPWEHLGAHTRGSALAHVFAENLGQLSEVIDKLPELQRLADVLGRIEKLHGGKESRERSGRSRVEGVMFGAEPSDLLTSELSLLGDAGTEGLFDLRFVERKLFQLEWSGGEPGGRRVPERTVPRGPVIVCVDTSASMTGAPLTIARAAALALIRRALGEKRAVHTLLFGGKNAMTSIDFYPGRVDATALFTFLAASFGGGTDYAGPLRKALEIRARGGRFARADIAVVSDGIAAIPREIVSAIAKARADGMRLGAMAILRPGRDAGILADLADPLEKLETGAFSV